MYSEFQETRGKNKLCPLSTILIIFVTLGPAFLELLESKSEILLSGDNPSELKVVTPTPISSLTCSTPKTRKK